MNRRRFLAGSLSAPAVVTAGCLNTADAEADCTGEWSPDLDGDEPTLAPGDSATIRIEAASASGLYLRVPVDDENLEIDVAEATVSPSPDRTADTYPPKWYWENCTSVEVLVPVQAATDARSDEYHYTVHAVQPLDEDGDTADRTFSVTVSSN